MVTTRRQISRKQRREEEEKRKREKALKSIRKEIKERGILTLSSNLSNDVTSEILSIVPVEDLLQFKSACKSWYTLLHDPFFIRVHLNQSIINNKIAFMIYIRFNDVYSVDCDISSSSLKLSRAVKIDCPYKFADIGVYGSCNGIFLIRIFHQFQRIGLWNPFTREYKDLTKNFSNYPKHPPPFYEVAFWLGYDASKDDYKVIRYPYYHDVSINWAIMSDVYVYSLRTNSCKKIQDVPYYIFGSVYPNLSCDDGKGIMLNGAIHWLGKCFSDATRGFSLKIVSFDLASDEFKDLQLPDVLLNTNSKRLGAFEECLCIYHVNKDHYIDVFMMKEYGVKESWTKMFSINDQPIQCMRIFKPMCVTQDGKLLAHWYLRDLALYDSKHEGRKCGDFKIQGIPPNFLYYSNTCTFVKSLVSLGANTCM